jgi:hypothetical protein
MSHLTNLTNAQIAMKLFELADKWDDLYDQLDANGEEQAANAYSNASQELKDWIKTNTGFSE